MRTVLAALLLVFVAPSSAMAERWYGNVHVSYKKVTEKEDATGDTTTTSLDRKDFSHEITAQASFPRTGSVATIKVRNSQKTRDFHKGTHNNTCPHHAPGMTMLREDTYVVVHAGSRSTKLKPADLHVSVQDDGSYTISIRDDFGVDRAGWYAHKHVFGRNQCPNSHPIDQNEKTRFRLDLAGAYIQAKGQAALPAEGGPVTQLNDTYEEVEEIPGGTVKTTVTFSLARRPLVVEAVPGGPYKIFRGAKVTLNGSKSKGPITSYKWKLVPAGADCPADFEGAELDGAVQGFQALCSLYAFLSVSGDGDTDTKGAQVDVLARPWRTEFATVKDGEYDEPLTRDHLSFGKNRCSLDLAEPNHFIHRDSADWSWEGAGYKLAEVAGGPFAGYWYVSKESLRISRVAQINRQLTEGDAYARNVERNSKNLQLMIKQVLTHERLHSELVEERLRKSAAGYDPALKIEALVTRDHDSLRKAADSKIAIVENELQEATLEPHVKNRMRELAEFKKPGFLVVNDGSGSDTTWKFSSFADLEY